MLAMFRVFFIHCYAHVNKTCLLNTGSAHISVLSGVQRKIDALAASYMAQQIEDAVITSN